MQFGRFSVLLSAGASDDFFALLIHDLRDNTRLAAGLGSAYGQHDFRARLQRFFGPDLAPAIPNHRGWIGDDFGMPVLDVPLFVDHIEQHERMWVDVLEIHDNCLGRPWFRQIVGDAASMMGEYRD